MNDNIDQIIAQIREKHEQYSNLHRASFDIFGLLALANAYGEALATMRKVAQERQDALAEFRLARDRADALGEMLTAVENAAGCSVESPSLVQRITDLTAERDRLREERDALRAERDDWYRAGLSIASSLSMEPEVSCPGIVEAVRELINAKAALKTERDAVREQIHDMCHDLHLKEPAVTVEDFCAGCEKFHIRKFGGSPITKLREENAMLLRERDKLYDKLADAHRETAK